MGVVLAIAVGVIGVVVNSSNLAKGLGDSVRAFHIADSGIEQALYSLRKQGSVPPLNINCTNDFSSFGASVCSVGIANEASSIVIKSTGTYNGSQRRIQATY